MLKLIATIVMSLMLMVPVMAQDCYTPDMALVDAVSQEPAAYELDRLVVPDLGVIVFYASPNQELIIALSFDTNDCFIGNYDAITVDEYESATGKPFLAI